MGEKLELRLKSPVGAEPAVYPWPLPVYVSTAPPLRLPAAPPPGPPPCRGARRAHRATEQRGARRAPGARAPARPRRGSPRPFPAPARRVGSGQPGPGGASADAGTPRLRGSPEPGLPLPCGAGTPVPPALAPHPAPGRPASSLSRVLCFDIHCFCLFVFFFLLGSLFFELSMGSPLFLF